MSRDTIYAARGKRTLDLLLAIPLCLAFAPLIAAVGIAVRRSMGSPVLFTQERPGLHGRTFRILKFRTMRNAVNSEGQPLPDELRLTRLGTWLRRWSLDELPELFNVLRGEMSLVGPRPLLAEYLGRYSPEQTRRHEVRPGITGWAQIHGRNAVTWKRRLELDVWYVDHVGLGLDLAILWRTLRVVSSGRGVAAPGHATMEAFKGSGTEGDRE